MSFPESIPLHTHEFHLQSQSVALTVTLEAESVITSTYNSPIVISAQKIPVTIAFWGSKSGYGNVTAHSISSKSPASCHQLPFTNSYFIEKL